jgi:RNA polymerase sigma factor (sigma-70 family)
MNDVSQWKDIIEKTVNKDARNFPADQREDIVQDCWLKLLEVHDQIDAVVAEKGEYDARGYVMEVCRNVVMDTLRKVVKQVKCEPLDNHIRQVPDKQDTNPFGVSRADLLEALDHLPQTSRFVIDCMFFRNMTEDQTGEQVGKSRIWIHREKVKAVGLLRDLLKETEVKGKDAPTS